MAKGLAINTLTVEPRGGLCNRMRAMDGAIALAADTGMAVRIVWKIDQSLGCPLDTLFEPIPGVAKVEQRRAFIMRRRDLVWFRRRLPLPCHDAIYLEDDIERLIADNHDFTALSRQQAPYIRTGKRIHRPFGPARLFRLQPPLLAEVERREPDLRAGIGVHIRHGDHRPGNRFSPTALFAQRMAEILRDDPQTSFFLATDDAEAERQLTAEFRGRISVREKSSRNRSVASAIEDAAIDLYCLARTRRLLGTTASSFSRMAAELGGQPLDFVTSRTDEPLVW
ncbi:MAG: hypothetical protein AAF416_16440 [Pseudomonadota bacterium]